jgi:hypothetical protein
MPPRVATRKQRGLCYQIAEARQNRAERANGERLAHKHIIQQRCNTCQRGYVQINGNLIPVTAM